MDEAEKIIRDGGIVIFPTDTAYGIGCRIDFQKSVEKLFDIRRRPQSQAVPALFDSIEQVKSYVLPIESEVEEKLINEFWPGALTIVLSCRVERVSALVRGGGKSLGVRIPDHTVPIGLIRASGVPILGPSANFHGEKTPFKFEDLDKELIKKVDFVVSGKTGGEKTSTVVDCTKRPWKILREGAVNIQI